MIFLIEYDRPKGVIVTFKTYEDADRGIAEEARLQLELDLRKKSIVHEVVILEALDQKHLRQTHRRYFEDLGQIGRSIGDSAA